MVGTVPDYPHLIVVQLGCQHKPCTQPEGVWYSSLAKRQNQTDSAVSTQSRICGVSDSAKYRRNSGKLKNKIGENETK